MNLVVVGAGTMGQGIAQVGLAVGHHTHMVDVSEDILAAARESVLRRLDRADGKRDNSPRERSEAGLRLTVGRDLAAACHRADVVIETASEDLQVKVEILTSALAESPAEALLATNTSALSVTEMGAASGAADRIVGLHFFNPPPRMRLIEVVRGLETSEPTVRKALEFCNSLGKEPVVLNDTPAFVASRINALIGNEAFTMFMEGVASAEDIDKAVRLGLNHPMGPFELGDLVGWDVRLKVLHRLHQSLGDRFRPNPLMVRYVEAGRLGRKTGRGVYEYPTT